MSAPLQPEQQRRGRRLAIASHAVGQIHNTGMAGDLVALALIALGAGEALVGGQRALLFAVMLLQLPTLRYVGRVSKRNLLLAGQLFALAASLPLLAFSEFASLGPTGLGLAMLCFTLAGAGFAVKTTVWFPLLHGYLEPEQTGRFFGILRTSWHFTLIPFLLGAQAWLDARPGDFGPIFGFAVLCGIVRVILIARLPERSEQTGAPLDLRAAFRFVWRREGWLAYFSGVTVSSACRSVFLVFGIVMMRRDLGFSEGDVLLASASVFAGGLASLYASGHLVDRFGPVPVFHFAAWGQALAVLTFVFAALSGEMALATAVGVFFCVSLLASAFDVADTRVLFALTPPERPAQLLVPTTVIKAMVSAALPLAAGFGLESAIERGFDATVAYSSLFLALSVGIALGYLPLIRFRRGGSRGDVDSN